MPSSNLYDLLSVGSHSQTLRDTLRQFDIKVDENKLYERNQTKQQLLSQIFSDLHLTDKVFEGKRADGGAIKDIQEQKAQNDADFFKNAKLTTLIKCLMIRRLSEESMAIYMHQEEVKKAMQELRDLIEKIAAEDQAQKLAAYEIQRARAEEAMYRAIMDDLQKQQDNAMENMRNARKEIEEADKKIKELKAEKHAALDEIANELTDTFEDYTTSDGVKLFEGVDRDKHTEFNRAVTQDFYRIEKERAKLNAELAEIRAGIKDVPVKGGFPTSSYANRKAEDSHPRVKEIKDQLAVLDRRESEIVEKQVKACGLTQVEKRARKEDYKELTKAYKAQVQPKIKQRLLSVKSRKNVEVKKMEKGIEKMDAAANEVNDAKGKKQLTKDSMFDKIKVQKDDKKEEKSQKEIDNDDDMAFLMNLKSKKQEKEKAKAGQSK